MHGLAREFLDSPDQTLDGGVQGHGAFRIGALAFFPRGFAVPGRARIAEKMRCVYFV
jgi:hypothetical protein